MSLPKEDIIPVLQNRRIAKPLSQLWKTSVAELNSMLGELSLEEQQIVETRRASRSPYMGYKLPDIQALAKQYDIPYSGLTKGGLIDVLLSTTPVQPVQLDPDQLLVVEKWNWPELIIVAGPGAGKTTTICALARRILYEQPTSRIVILTFNRAAEEILRKRLKIVGVDPGTKTNLRNQGCFPLTFDKYLYHARLESLSTGHRMAFEAGLTISPRVHECWDWLIIDEAQDIQPNHQRLIEQLQPLAKHVIIAGDPRQELYPGAEWFSNLCICRPSIQTLRYNHRSAPGIVDFLNQFSREHFPNLHHDQIPVRTDIPGIVSFEVSETPGIVVGNKLLQHDVGDAYAITPITVSKFNNDSVVNTIRQVVWEERPGVGMTIMDDGSYLHTGSYFIGTSRKLKGTERKSVVVFQVDTPYLDYGIPLTSLIKAIFVALSRGQDEVHVVLSRPPVVGEIFASVSRTYHITVKEAQAETKLPVATRACVWEDLTKLTCWKPQSIEAFQYEPIEITSGSDADFVGLYCEAYVAAGAGAQLRRIIRFRPGVKDELTGVFHIGASQDYEAVYDPHHFKSPEKLIEQYEQLKEKNPEYAFTMVKFSVQIGKIWTVSERLRTEKPFGALKYSRIVESWLSQGIRHGYRIRMPIMIHRSRVQAGYIIGEADFASSTGVIEMKHGEHQGRHIIQTGIYATLLNLPNGLLMNTKLGTTIIVRAISLDELSDVARSFLVFKHAQIHGVRLPFRQPRSITTEVIISVDIETEDGLITEIGAWAFGAEQIYGVYQEIAEGTDLSDSITGLSIVDRNKTYQDQARMLIKFHQWVESLSQVRTWLHWAGAEPIALKLTGPTIDVYKLFTLWLQQTKQDRKSDRTLSDAVSQILGPVPFVPHRAFEDAVLTGGIFIAITNIGGSL